MTGRRGAHRRTRPARAIGGLAAALVAGLAGAAPAMAVIAPAAAPTTTAPPPTAPYALVDGVFHAPDGTFSVAFPAAPVVAGEPPGFVAPAGAAGGDSATVIGYPPDAFGATAETTPDQRARLFLDAAGEGVEILANTPTRLGTVPTAYFIGRVALDPGGPGAVYGAVVVRPFDVLYVVYTDVGADDADAGRRFVESFTLHLPAVAPGSTGVTTAPDGSWWVTFPAGSTAALRASSAAGLAFAEYRAVVGGDVATVRVTEIPAGYEWAPTAPAGFPEVSVEPSTTDVDGRSAAAWTFGASAGTVHALELTVGRQLITLAYLDAGGASTAAAEAFVGSFGLRAS